MNLTVLVPTYRRIGDLRRCLSALGGQTRLPDQVVVVTRDDDAETGMELARRPAEHLPLEVVRVVQPGQVAALNAGLRTARGDVVAILDDDTAPWPDWLARIERHFATTPGLGGLGGRDIIRSDGFPSGAETSLVGRVTWYGRWIGQAHRGAGPPRDVDLLKGCNMSFRGAAIRGLWFDRRLKGSGAQWFNDAAFSLAVKRAGWRVIYDPAVRVDHYLGARHAGDEREAVTPADVYGAVYNETLILLEHLGPLRRAAYLGYGATVGTRRAPGLLRWIRARYTGRSDPRFNRAAWRGRLDAWRDFRRDRGRGTPAQGGTEAVSL